MEALLAGETLRSQQLTYSSEIHLTKEGKLSSGSFEMFNRIPPEQWAIKPKEPEWFAARKGRITASSVGAILGLSPLKALLSFTALTNEEIEAFKR